MAKRFTDTNKYKKTFFRSLPAAYKLFWDYLYHDCDHAGIWHVDIEIAQIYVGKECEISLPGALSLFNSDEERIVVIHGGVKWFIPQFISFQYGPLNPNVKAHSSALFILEKEGIDPYTLRVREGLANPYPKSCLTLKDMDKDKDKDEDHMLPPTKDPLQTTSPVSKITSTLKEPVVLEEKPPKPLKKPQVTANFTQPSLKEVSDYCAERNNQVDPEHFVDSYTSKGWMVGKNKMKCWRAAVRTWEKNNFSNNQKGSASSQLSTDEELERIYGKSK